MFGVAHETVRKWVAAGCPAVRKSDGSKGGAGWQFSSADVIAWYAAREKASVKRGEHVDLDEAKRRKLAAEAELAELDAAERRGDLVKIADVAAIVAEEYGACRSRLLGMPTKLAPILATTTDINEVRALLDAAIREALDEIRYEGGSISRADRETTAGADDGTAGGVETAADTDSEPVGGSAPQVVA
jgi:phage terminase Nu1 subunit (DNA packaging protein)